MTIPALWRGCVALVLTIVVQVASAAEARGWDSVPGILTRITAPQFPARDFDIIDFGAAPGGADCTDELAQAVAATGRA